MKYAHCRKNDGMQRYVVLENDALNEPVFCCMYMLRSEKTLQSLYLKMSITGTPFSFCALHLRRRFPILKVQKKEEIALKSSRPF